LVQDALSSAGRHGNDDNIDLFFSDDALEAIAVVLLPIALSETDVAEILSRAQTNNGYQLTADLERQVLEDSQGLSTPFAVGDFQRYCLLEGLDECIRKNNL